MRVELVNTTFGYGGRPVVHVDHAAIDRGACLGVYGPNGAGKTTLVRGLTGLLRPQSGTVRRDPGLRYGYLPQRRGFDRGWPMTGFDATAMALSCRAPFGWVGRRAAGAVVEAAGQLRVDHLLDARFSTLSGGQQQRLMLAGALAAAPDLLVFDEPTEGLDVASRDAFLDAVRGALARGVAAVLVSHEAEDLAALATRVALLRPSYDGSGSSEVRLTDPAELMPAAPVAAGVAP